MVEGIIHDLYSSGPVILIGLAISMIVSFLWILIMRFAAGVMVWISIIAIFVLQGAGEHLWLLILQSDSAFNWSMRWIFLNGSSLFVGCWFCFKQYRELDNVESANQSPTQIVFTTNLSSYLAMKQTWMIFLIVLAVTMALTLLALIFLRNRIRIAIALIGQGSKWVY